MYVMPLGYNDTTKQYRVFFEETSLITPSADSISFEECKLRAYQRLAYHGIKIESIEGIEYCSISMGGELPSSNQSILAMGSAAGLVHPATGYSFARSMYATQSIAQYLGQVLRSPAHASSSVVGRKHTKEIVTHCNDYILWHSNHRRQRDFQVSEAYHLFIYTKRALNIH
jgi:lycopene cyclase-like protein